MIIMEKIRLGSGKELEIIVCGIAVTKETLTIKCLPAERSLDELNTVFLDSEETTKMILLSDSDESLAVYNDYTELQSIGQEPNAVIGYTQDEEAAPITGKMVTVMLGKKNEIVTKLQTLEAQLTDTQIALCEIYEGIEV